MPRWRDRGETGECFTGPFSKKLRTDKIVVSFKCRGGRVGGEEEEDDDYYDEGDRRREDNEDGIEEIGGRGG